MLATPYADAMPIKWADAPSDDDLADAGTYLSLIGVTVLGPVETVQYYLAKDLIRAGRLTVLPRDNAGVRKYLERYRKGVEIAPCLIVPGSLVHDVPLHIPEGYHRVCAAYHVAEDTPVATVGLRFHAVVDADPEPSP